MQLKSVCPLEYLFSFVMGLCFSVSARSAELRCADVLSSRQSVNLQSVKTDMPTEIQEARQLSDNNYYGAALSTFELQAIQNYPSVWNRRVGEILEQQKNSKILTTKFRLPNGETINFFELFILDAIDSETLSYKPVDVDLALQRYSRLRRMDWQSHVSPHGFKFSNPTQLLKAMGGVDQLIDLVETMENRMNFTGIVLTNLPSGAIEHPLPLRSANNRLISKSMIKYFAYNTRPMTNFNGLLEADPQTGKTLLHRYAEMQDFESMWALVAIVAPFHGSNYLDPKDNQGRRASSYLSWSNYLRYFAGLPAVRAKYFPSQIVLDKIKELDANDSERRVILLR